MRKNKSNFLIILLLGIFVFTSCATSKNNIDKYSKEIAIETAIAQNTSSPYEYESQSLDYEKFTNENIRELLSTANNMSIYTDLLTIEYSYDNLMDWDERINNIEDFNAKYSIECLRKVNKKTYYSISKTDEGGILIVLFEGENLEIKDYVYINSFINKETFEHLNIGDTMECVYRIDQNGDYMAFYLGSGGLYSFHRTIDGYKIRIDYGFDYAIQEWNYNETDLIVKDISSVKIDESFIYENILSIDIETMLSLHPVQDWNDIEHGGRNAAEILSSANNKLKYTDLVTLKNSDDLFRCSRYGLDIEYIDAKYPLECLRKVNKNTYYAILKSDEGLLDIILFKKTDENRWESSDFWYMDSLLYKNMFENLKVGDKPSDVWEIGKYGNKMSYVDTDGTKIDYTLYQTIDGYTIKIYYNNTSYYRDRVITNIEITKSNKNSIYKNLIRRDIKTIKEELGEK